MARTASLAAILIGDKGSRLNFKRDASTIPFVNQGQGMCRDESGHFYDFLY